MSVSRYPITKAIYEDLPSALQHIEDGTIETIDPPSPSLHPFNLDSYSVDSDGDLLLEDDSWFKGEGNVSKMKGKNKVQESVKDDKPRPKKDKPKKGKGSKGKARALSTSDSEVEGAHTFSSPDRSAIDNRSSPSVTTPHGHTTPTIGTQAGPSRRRSARIQAAGHAQTLGLKRAHSPDGSSDFGNQDDSGRPPPAKRSKRELSNVFNSGSDFIVYNYSRG